MSGLPLSRSYAMPTRCAFAAEKPPPLEEFTLLGLRLFKEEERWMNEDVAEVVAGSAAAVMEMVGEGAAVTVVAEMARAVTAAAMELVVRVAAAKAAVTGRVRMGRGAAAAKDQGILETVMVAGWAQAPCWSASEPDRGSQNHRTRFCINQQVGVGSSAARKGRSAMTR